MVSILSLESGLPATPVPIGDPTDAISKAAGSIAKGVVGAAINLLVSDKLFPPDSVAYTLSIDTFGIMGAFTKIQGLGVELELEPIPEGGANFSRPVTAKGLKWPPIQLFRALAISSDLFRWLKEETGYDADGRPMRGRNMSVTAFTRHGPWSGMLPSAAGLPTLGGVVDLSTLVDVNMPIRTWNFMNAVPVKWDGPGWDAATQSMVSEALTIQHDGFTEGGIGALTGGFIG